MYKISVIVPIYNSEKFLSECVDSILGQTYPDLEVLLIDDGSPDNCPVLCDDYARQDDRVRVIHQKNAGVAAARNTGLDAATGDYITFVDSDDYIDADMYETMMAVAEKHDCDVVMCDCVKEFGDHQTLYTHDIRPGFYSRDQLLHEYFQNLLMMPNIEYPPTISNWLCLFRHRHSQGASEDETKAHSTYVTGNDNALKRKHTIRYLEGVRYSEDLLFGAELMYGAESFYYMKGEALYHYRMNQDSATHRFVPDKWQDYLRLHDGIRIKFADCPEYDFREQIDHCLLFFLYNAVGDIWGADALEMNEKRRAVRGILITPCVRQMFRRTKVRRLQIPTKLKILTGIYKYRVGVGLYGRYVERRHTSKKRDLVSGEK